jgi:hypothetical protein
MGILGKVEAGVGIGVAVVAVGGAYYVYKKLPEWAPEGIGKAIGDWFGNLWGGFGGGGPTTMFTFDKDAARQGERFGIFAEGLIPNSTLTYGWKELGYTQTLNTLSSGHLDLQYVEISPTTPPGTYTIFLDQRAQGGKYGERKFTVLPADGPDPNPEDNVPYRIEIRSDDYSIPVSGSARITVSLFNQYSDPAKARRNVGIFWRGAQIRSLNTSATTGVASTTITGSFLRDGTHTLQAVILPTNNQDPITDFIDITVG